MERPKKIAKAVHSPIENSDEEKEWSEEYDIGLQLEKNKYLVKSINVANGTFLGRHKASKSARFQTLKIKMGIATKEVIKVSANRAANLAKNGNNSGLESQVLNEMVELKPG